MYKKKTLGKIGIVKRIFKDNDLKIEISERTWTFNPLLVSKLNNTMSNPATTSHAANYDANVMDDDSRVSFTLAPSKDTILRSTSLINELSSSLFDLTEG